MSARWAEMMPGGCKIRYIGARAQEVEDMPSGEQGARPLNVVVDIGDATPDEARWLAATTEGNESFWSPWSTRLQSGPRFFISRRPRLGEIFPPPTATYPTSRQALYFLDKFCLRHNIVDQSHAALAAVLLFPSVPESTKVLHLPAVVVNTQSTPPINKRLTSGLRHAWLFRSWQTFDRLVTLGCNVHGTESMLLSAFYEPGIECNAVTPWLQGALAAIDSLAFNKPQVLGRMMMERKPQIAFLWVGAVILGLDKELLATVRRGCLPYNLNAAAWTDSEQSFLQEPVREPLALNGMITRADQCRLLAMWRKTSDFVAPGCPWAPPGSTSLEHIDPDVRLHSSCSGHRLRYRRCIWYPDMTAKPTNAPGITSIDVGSSNTPTAPREASVDDWQLYLGHQYESEDATLSMCAYMAFASPFSAREKKIWTDSWRVMIEGNLGLTSGSSNDEDDEDDLGSD
ncbi:hypothetical protein B0I37DRAFT_74253 [Chaetomium sp. MPI-CAGE-AT-0009]|nr:hypothetical protein B0I37DRAFT_74253 [Chaetomium sp. MPI-CAGE-AT-0009]